VAEDRSSDEVVGVGWPEDLARQPRQLKRLLPPAPASELDDQEPAPDRPAEVAKGRSASELAAAKASEPNPTEELARHLENVCKLSLSKIEEILSLPTDSSNGNLLRATMSWTSPSRARRRWA
jgi:hypothetical protein